MVTIPTVTPTFSRSLPLFTRAGSYTIASYHFVPLLIGILARLSPALFAATRSPTLAFSQKGNRPGNSNCAVTGLDENTRRSTDDDRNTEKDTNLRLARRERGTNGRLYWLVDASSVHVDH